MAETGRIRVAKDKAELVKSLTSANASTGPFQTFADVVGFAAALGAKNNKRVPLGEISKREPSPIRLEYFATTGHDWIVKLLGVTETKDIKVLSYNEVDAETQRNHIFEEFANGGLEILQKELCGAVDYTERLLLILSSERFKEDNQEEEFDLSRFLS